MRLTHPTGEAVTTNKWNTFLSVLWPTTSEFIHHCRGQAGGATWTHTVHLNFRSFKEIRHKSLPAVWTHLHTKWQLTGEVGFSDCWLNSVGCYRCQTECWGALCWATLTATPHIPLCSSPEHTHLAANTMNSYTHKHTIQWHWLISHSCLLLFCTKHFAETNLSVKILLWIHLNLNELSESVSISLQAGHTHLRKVQEIFVSIWADGIAARRTLACANQCRRLPVSLMGVDRSSVAAVLWNSRC